MQELDKFQGQRPDPDKIYPRPKDNSTCYLKNIIKDPNIIIDDFTFYNDFSNPLDFEKNNVLYHYPINNERLIIGKFCSIACGAKLYSIAQTIPWVHSRPTLSLFSPANGTIQ
jgi:acetyltransferase-like isoleucine patch superfamily enzyme